MKQINQYFLQICLVAIVCLVGTSCSKENSTPKSLTSTVSNQVALDWYYLTLELNEQTPGFTGPIVARAYAYLGITMYESVVPGMPGFHSIAGSINGYRNPGGYDIDLAYDWNIVCNRAMYTVVNKLYRNTPSSLKKEIFSLYNNIESKYASEVDDETFKRSIAYGEKIGLNVYNYSVADQQELAYTNNYPQNYVSPNQPESWKPTSRSQNYPLLSHWGNVRTFIVNNAQSTQPAKPLNFSKEKQSEFYKSGLEVYNTVRNLTREQELIALYWNDEAGNSATPNGHIMAILLQLLKEQNANLDKCAEALLRMGIALHDAHVSCWKTKFTYNLMCPETYIKENIDNGFLTLINTPSLPEYSSCHAVIAATSAQIFAGLFGKDFGFTDRTLVGKKEFESNPRSFKNFNDMASEMAMSRVYAGVQFRFSTESGLSQGNQIGTNVMSISLRR